jgi:hypothetical protein
MLQLDAMDLPLSRILSDCDISKHCHRILYTVDIHHVRSKIMTSFFEKCEKKWMRSRMSKNIACSGLRPRREIKLMLLNILNNKEKIATPLFYCLCDRLKCILNIIQFILRSLNLSSVGQHLSSDVYLL